MWWALIYIIQMGVPNVAFTESGVNHVKDGSLGYCSIYVNLIPSDGKQFVPCIKVRYIVVNFCQSVSALNFGPVLLNTGV